MKKKNSLINITQAQVISWTLALFFSLFLKISLTEEDTVEPLMNRHARGMRKVSVTGAGHLQGCKKYSHSVCMGVEKNTPGFIKAAISTAVHLQSFQFLLKAIRSLI